MCVYMYIYIYIYIHTFTYIYIYIYMLEHMLGEIVALDADADDLLDP